MPSKPKPKEITMTDEAPAADVVEAAAAPLTDEVAIEEPTLVDGVYAAEATYPGPVVVPDRCHVLGVEVTSIGPDATTLRVFYRIGG